MRQRIRAERKAGQMLKEMEKNKGAKGKGINQYTKEVRLPEGTTPPTLADIGISRKQSSNWQRIAEIPEAEFEKSYGL